MAKSEDIRKRLNEKQWTVKEFTLGTLKVSDSAQRDLKQYRVDALLAHFDPDKIGIPVINVRTDLSAWIIDGQHRVASLIAWLGSGWEKQPIPCRTYQGLTEEEEAEMFLILNDVLAVNHFDRFRIAVKASRPSESGVTSIVAKCGLHVSKGKGEGCISCVTTLLGIYNKQGGPSLERAIRIAHESFGDPGLDRIIVLAVAHVVGRYGKALDDKHAIDRLNSMKGGAGALLAKARVIQNQTRAAFGLSAAAAIVDVINGRGGHKLPSWWKE